MGKALRIVSGIYSKYLSILGKDAELRGKKKYELEFILAGATAVSVGTANFFNPRATMDVVEGIEAYMKRKNVEDINSLIGLVD